MAFKLVQIVCVLGFIVNCMIWSQGRYLSTRQSSLLSTHGAVNLAKRISFELESVSVIDDFASKEEQVNLLHKSQAVLS